MEVLRNIIKRSAPHIGGIDNVAGVSGGFRQQAFLRQRGKNWSIFRRVVLVGDRINQAVKEALDLPDAKVPSNIARYGNTSSATIPILMDELLRAEQVRRGQLVCFLALGAGLNWPVLPNVMLVASVLYTKTDGSADFASQNNFGSPLPITAYDDAKRSTLNLKGIWNVNRNWELTGGYAWEKYDYSDFQFNNYQNLNPPPPAPISTTTSYLTGYYAYPDYRAGILYLIGKYRF